MLQEELITFETAKLAKELGFDEECMQYFEWYIYDEKQFGPTAIGRKPIDFRKWNVRLEETLKRPELYNKVFAPMKNSTAPPYHFARPTQDLLDRWLRDVHGLIIGI